MNHTQMHFKRETNFFIYSKCFASIRSLHRKKWKKKQKVKLCTSSNLQSTILPVDLNLLIYLVVRCSCEGKVLMCKNIGQKPQLSESKNPS